MYIISKVVPTSQEEQYVHLESDLEVLKAKVDEYTAAHDEIFNKISKQQLHEDPAVLVCQINNKRKVRILGILGILGGGFELPPPPNLRSF